jgi:hypothetical protein
MVRAEIFCAAPPGLDLILCLPTLPGSRTLASRVGSIISHLRCLGHNKDCSVVVANSVKEKKPAVPMTISSQRRYDSLYSLNNSAKSATQAATKVHP